MIGKIQLYAIAASMLIAAAVGAWIYINTLQNRIESLESEVVSRPIEAKADAYHQTAIERIKEIEEEYRDANESVGDDSNHSSGVADIDWMFR